MQIRKSLAVLGGIAASLALRYANVPEKLSRISYYDAEECYEYLLGNTHAERPYLSMQVLGSVLGAGAFSVLMFLCDLGGAVLLKDIRYLVGCSLFHADVSSAINFLWIAYYVASAEKREKTSRACMGALLVLSMEFTGSSHLPGINPYWYMNMHMLEQYRSMCTQGLLATHLMLVSFAQVSSTVAAKMFLMCVFKECGYKGYFLIWWLVSLEAGALSMRGVSVKAFHGLKHTSAMLAIVEHIIWAMIVVYGIGNMNFLCWSTLVFVLATGGGVLLLEVEKQYLVQKKKVSTKDKAK
ncbi:hypothetical protein NECID01_1643 [Nematocida sp. AWRm77]|nr:hypothetical protein NECID01_1643 [Nematocida sp. AWRm77]